MPTRRRRLRPGRPGRPGCPAGLALEQRQLLGGRMPAAQPVQVLVEIGAYQPHLRFAQTTQLKLRGMLVTQALGRIRFIQSQGETLQQPLVQPTSRHTRALQLSHRTPLKVPLGSQPSTAHRASLAFPFG
ncbi:hypothetical protein CSB91_5419 [Pseudomonas aeruginosa]|nr:hypothetical protein CSB91_5419 [Pseudomonas aeruginosa]